MTISFIFFFFSKICNQSDSISIFECYLFMIYIISGEKPYPILLLSLISTFILFDEIHNHFKVNSNVTSPDPRTSFSLLESTLSILPSPDTIQYLLERYQYFHHLLEVKSLNLPLFQNHHIQMH